MSFDVDHAERALRELSSFMASHSEPKWAEIVADCEARVVAVDEEYEAAVKMFLEATGPIWGGPQGGGLFESSDRQKWQNGPPEDRLEFEKLRIELHGLRVSADQSLANLEKGK